MGTTKKTASVYGKRIFKIEVTAIYNEDMEAEQIADELSEGLFNSLKKNGKRLVVLNVDSVKVPSKPDDVAMGIIRELSRQKQESMSMQETDEGSKYVVVEKKQEEHPNVEVKEVPEQEVLKKEEPKQEEPKPEEPKKEESKAEPPMQEEPKKEETPKEIEKEIPEKENSEKEAPKKETPKKKESKKEAPKKESPKKEKPPKKEESKKKPEKKTAPKKKLPEPEQDVKKAEPVKETVPEETKQETVKSFPKTKIHPIGIPKAPNASADTRPTLNDIFGFKRMHETKENPKPNAVAKKGKAVKNEKRA